MRFLSKCREVFKKKPVDNIEKEEREKTRFLNNGEEIISILPSQKSNVLKLRVTADEPIFSAIIEELSFITNANVKEDIVEIIFNSSEEVEAFLEDWI